jgi:hypothetical protein
LLQKLNIYLLYNITFYSYPYLQEKWNMISKCLVQECSQKLYSWGQILEIIQTSTSKRMDKLIMSYPHKETLDNVF